MSRHLDDTVAWVSVDGTTTLGIYRHDAWWTNVDADETGVSGWRHEPDTVEVVRVLTVASDPERRPAGVASAP